MQAHTDRTEPFERERAHLLALAFRILGSDADAQDVVQEAWLRYARADAEDVRNVAAWLTTVVTRLCLDALRRGREEPREPGVLAEQVGAAQVDPEETVVLASELGEAFTVVLEQLTPPQRVALVLHDVFGTPFDEVARILDTTPLSARRLASRARARLRGSESRPRRDSASARRVVAQFLVAARRCGSVESRLSWPRRAAFRPLRDGRAWQRSTAVRASRSGPNVS